MRLLALTGLLLLTFSGLQSAAAAGDLPQALTPDEGRRRIDQFLQARPTFLNRRWLHEFRRLASLRRETVEKVPNPHVGDETLEYRTLLFDGLEVTGLVERAGGFSPVVVKVTGTRWTLPSGLNVGTPGSRIVTILGPPMENTDSTLTYQGTSDQVAFRVRRGVIAEITLQYYHD